MLPPEKAEQFGRIAQELEATVAESFADDATPEAKHDPRRNRFLLRLVVSRVSHLFTGDRPMMPRSLIEGLDRYLVKAFGPIMYEECNVEADQTLVNLNTDDDHAMWDGIRKSPQMRRFVDTLFIRLLFRFENFPNGKKTFISIIDRTMQDVSHYNFGESQFNAVFEALFSDLWLELKKDEQRLRWDFLFGDGTSAKLAAILTQGLERWLKRQEGGKMLAASSGAAKRRESDAAEKEAHISAKIRGSA